MHARAVRTCARVKGMSLEVRRLDTLALPEGECKRRAAVAAYTRGHIAGLLTL